LWWDESAPLGVPYGYCWCGCGEPTGTWKETERARGHLAGSAKRFIHGHNARKPLYRHVVVNRGHGTPCWIWSGNRTTNGYGTFQRDGIKISPHRAYYIEYRGEIPEDKHLDHLCRTPACVNPDHLEPVTPADNKRRASKLTLEMVSEIRRLARKGSYSRKHIGQMFGISQGHLSEIINLKSWC
jgi:hypothetical protein